jgi:hypothetical protein
MKIGELIDLNIEAHKIVDSDLSWKAKYDLIFSDDISMKVKLDYYDPDTSYEEDVYAWMTAFDEYLGKYKNIKY